ncbi:Hypothetical predicted protein, partial [Pelobates cultripes]
MAEPTSTSERLDAIFAAFLAHMAEKQRDLPGSPTHPSPTDDCGGAPAGLP